MLLGCSFYYITFARCFKRYIYVLSYLYTYIYGEKGEKDVGRMYIEKRMKDRMRERLPLYYTSCVFSAPWKSTATIIRPDCRVYDNFSDNIENETPCAAAGEMLFYIIVSILFTRNISFISLAVLLQRPYRNTIIRANLKLFEIITKSLYDVKKLIYTEFV